MDLQKARFVRDPILTWVLSHLLQSCPKRLIQERSNLRKRARKSTKKRLSSSVRRITAKEVRAYLPSVWTSHTKFVEFLSDTETFHPFLNDESSDSLRSTFGIRLCVNDENVGIRSVLFDHVNTRQCPASYQDWGAWREIDLRLSTSFDHSTNIRPSHSSLSSQLSTSYSRRHFQSCSHS